jgi:hypothetical protein
MDAIAAVFGSERRDGVPATELFWRNIGRPISPHEWCAPLDSCCCWVCTRG